MDLTREQPLNNIARVAVQAVAGIFGGLQSLHTDSYDEVLSVPTEKAARIAVSTQNILKEEAHLTDVIDPLGGGYYIETLTNEMEEKITGVMNKIEDAGGMYRAVEQGLVQRMIGESALAFQEKVESGGETIVGVNKYRIDDADDTPREPLSRPPMEQIEAQLARLARFKADRSHQDTERGLDDLKRAAESTDQNVFEKVVDAAELGVTHGEICGCLRDVYGFGDPLIVP